MVSSNKTYDQLPEIATHPWQDDIQHDNGTAGITGLSECFSAKGQIANNFCFVGHVVSVASTQLYHYSMKTTMDNS